MLGRKLGTPFENKSGKKRLPKSLILFYVLGIYAIDKVDNR